jgi:hypothetical protein
MLHINGRHLIKPSSTEVAAHVVNGIYLCDTYQIKITWYEGAHYPQVIECSSKILKVAKRFGIKPIDVHLYPNGTFCLASWQDLIKRFENSFSLEIFFYEYLIPFLFSQTYFSIHKKWPWGELNHGCWGLLEWLSRQKKFDQKDIRRTAFWAAQNAGPELTRKLFLTRCRDHKPCPCGSRRKTRECHPDITTAISLIRGAISRGAFSIDNLI